MHDGKHPGLIVAAALALFAVACSSREEAPAPVFVADADAGELAAEIGTGFSAFEPVVDGAPIDVVAGPQGGFHIWTAIRIKDSSIDTAQVGLSARFAEGGDLAGKPSRAMVELAPVGGARERAGMTNFVSDPSAVSGKSIILRAEIVTADGRSATVECTVVPW